ncbi:hypothetical protein Hanom_Chr02g00113151 [Helianthus anomalus]
MNPKQILLDHLSQSKLTIYRFGSDYIDKRNIILPTKCLYMIGPLISLNFEFIL